MSTMDFYKLHTLLQIIVVLVAAFVGTDSQFYQQRSLPRRQGTRRKDRVVDYSPAPIYVAAVHNGQIVHATKGPGNSHSTIGDTVIFPYPFAYQAEFQYSQKYPAEERNKPPARQGQGYPVEEPLTKVTVSVTEAPNTVSGSTPTIEQCEREQKCVFYSVAEKHSAAVTGSVNATGLLFTQDHRNVCQDVTTPRFRTFDGTCNNPNNLGTSFTPLTRLLPAEYDDGEDTPRKRGEDGQPLPSARLVSRTVHQAGSSFQPFTHMLMQWGQWVDHDITGILTGSDRKNPIKCCGADGAAPPPNTNKNCFPIDMPAGEDHFVGSCMEFVRSLAATDSSGVQLKPREQVNSLNAFIDGSQVYGPTTERAALLRVPDDILMKTKGDFPPENPDQGCIMRNGTGDYCFLTGDIRVHENPALATLHVIWLREHNRMAKELQMLKPSESKEEIFQLTRKIIGAMQQVITYNDYLPLILGGDAQRLKLTCGNGRTIYNPEMDPRVFNAFSAAAMRFGHSSVPSAYMIGSRVAPLRELFSRPGPVLDDLDAVLLGLIGVNEFNERAVQTVDRDMVAEITKHLFQPQNSTQGRGLDLASLNLQRGRDHGIPPYTKWRAFCNLRPIRGFDDTEALGPHASELAKVYRSINDIDLFTGILHEPVDMGLVGPTGRCLVGLQFERAKFGDRFFFNNNIQHTAFNDQQVQALRRMTLAHTICYNTKIVSVPTNIFKFIDSSNPLVPCTQLKENGLDLSLF